MEFPQAQFCKKCVYESVCICVYVYFKLFFCIVQITLILGILAVNLMHDNYGLKTFAWSIEDH